MALNGLPMESIAILERLVGFPTVSRESNLDLIEFARDFLADCGVESLLVPDETGRKANLYATIGPRDRAGVMLSGHTDVVPVEGQTWSGDPFSLTARDGKLYGRGAADMKGFVACALQAARSAATRDLATPLHLALSHDEEIGCVGVRRLIDVLEATQPRPAFCIVGEPTGMAIARGHKGKVAALATCIGREGHSALAPKAVNAIHLACDLVAEIRRLQARISEEGARDPDYDIAYTTLHVGRIAGGTALNIVPNRCDVSFEIRNLAGDDAEALLGEIGTAAERIAGEARSRAPEAAIRIDIVNSYPGLDTPADAEVVALAKSLTKTDGMMKVAFGTEGGLFAQRLGIPTVVCGPGSMAECHKPDEFVSVEQIGRCDAMLAALIDRLETGL